MKHYYYIYLLSFIMITAFTSCQKEGASLFVGDYSYKTTGTLVINADNGDTLFSSIDQLGQMNIIDIDDDNRVMVVMKPLKGNIVTSYATISGTSITFETNTYSENLSTTLLSGEMYLTADVTGTIHNNMIIMDQTLSGTFDGTKNSLTGNEDINGTIIGKNVKIIAEKNNE